MKSGDPGWIRTNDRQLRRLLLYPAELQGRDGKGHKAIGIAIIQTERADPEIGSCRGGQIRTDDLLLPKQARYRATLRPEKKAR